MPIAQDTPEDNRFYVHWETVCHYTPHKIQRQDPIGVKKDQVFVNKN